MTLKRALSLSVLAVLLSVRGAAWAGDSPTPEEDRRAHELYLEGESHYAAGRYEQAAALFIKSYELSDRPELLFNVANCFERMGEYTKAAKYLLKYLDSPEARDVVSIQQRIKRLQMAAKQKQAEEERLRDDSHERDDKREEKHPPSLPPEPRHRDRKSLSTNDQVGFILVAAGGAGLVGAAVFGIAATGAGRDAKHLCSDGGLCPSAAQSPLDREKRFALFSDLSVGFGLVAGGVGAYLLLRNEHRAGPEERRAVGVAPALMPGGAGVALTGAW